MLPTKFDACSATAVGSFLTDSFDFGRGWVPRRWASVAQQAHGDWLKGNREKGDSSIPIDTEACCSSVADDLKKKGKAHWSLDPIHHVLDVLSTRFAVVRRIAEARHTLGPQESTPLPPKNPPSKKTVRAAVSSSFSLPVLRTPAPTHHRITTTNGYHAPLSPPSHLLPFSSFLPLLPFSSLLPLTLCLSPLSPPSHPLLPLLHVLRTEALMTPMS